MTHVHVGLVVPGLDVEEDGGLGDHLRLLGLLLVVGLQPLLGDSLLLLVVLLVIRPEKIHIIIVIVLTGRGSATTAHIGRGVLAGLGELVHAGREGLDVVVPSQGVRSVGLGGSGQGLVHSGVGLAGDKPTDEALVRRNSGANQSL